MNKMNNSLILNKRCHDCLSLMIIKSIIFILKIKIKFKSLFSSFITVGNKVTIKYKSLKKQQIIFLCFLTNKNNKVYSSSKIY